MAILGATASGKTGFSLDLAERLYTKIDQKSEIISVDSVQVYQGVDIASAKIQPDQMRGIPHHGLNLIALDQKYTAADFQTYAYTTIDAIQSRGKRAILCGGTMLWFDAVTEHYHFGNDPTQKSTRKDPPRYPCLKIGMYWERDALYERINQRARAQFQTGLIEEIQALGSSKLQHNIATSIGVPEVQAYLRGNCTLEEAITRNQQRNRNYAKRQMTWWRGRKDVLWMDATSEA